MVMFSSFKTMHSCDLLSTMLLLQNGRCLPWPLLLFMCLTNGPQPQAFLQLALGGWTGVHPPAWQVVAHST